MRSRYAKGFTLVEVMTVAAVFAILSTVVIANFRSGTRVQVLTNAANELASHIKQAQGLAYSNTMQPICSNPANTVCGSGVTCLGTCTQSVILRYGVALSTNGSASVNNKYMIGADYANYGTYVAGEAIPQGIVTLPANITITAPVSTLGTYDLIYQYDSANASPFKTCSTPPCTTTITLKDSITNVTKSVVVQVQTGTVSVN